MKQMLFWSPRVLTILFAVSLSLFAFDVFEEGYSFWGTVLAFLIHLIPVYMVIIILVIAWRWEWIGAILFFVMAILYLIMTRGRFHWSAYVSISGTLALIGILFLLDHFK
jgi:hypothetical protein